jgi:hypothetical protein
MSGTGDECSFYRLYYDMKIVCVCQKMKDLEGQIESLSGTTTPHSDDSQADKLTPMDPATVTNLVSLCRITNKFLNRLPSGKKYIIYTLVIII